MAATQGNPEFWRVAGDHHVRGRVTDVPPHVLVNCDVGFDFTVGARLAEALSQRLGGVAIGFLAQTAADVHELRAFDRGRRVRLLQYDRDAGGWTKVEGSPQPWETVYFFDPAATPGPDAATCSDMVDGSLTDAELARYHEAQRRGDASIALDLLHPSPLEP